MFSIAFVDIKDINVSPNFDKFLQGSSKSYICHSCEKGR